MLILHANAYVNGTFEPETCVRLEEGVVRETGAALAPHPGEEVVDAQGRYLLPGFVDVHIHAFRGKEHHGGGGRGAPHEPGTVPGGRGGFPAHDHERLGGGYPQRRGRYRRGDGTP